MTKNPFLDSRRGESEALAFQAEKAWTSGRHQEAVQAFAQAAVLEEAVAREVPSESLRVRGLLAISAVSLWYKASDFSRAKRLAYTFLAANDLSERDQADLETLVERCSREQELVGLALDRGMIPVEVKLDGGRVKKGIAPASAARRRRDTVTTLLMRSADLEAKRDYRERGLSDLDRNDEIQIFEVPSIAASYGLRFYVATGTQQTIASTATVTPDAVVRRFLGLAEAAHAGPSAVRAALPDPQYAKAFIEGFGEIAPDGEEVASVVCSAPTWKVSNVVSTRFEPKHRIELRAAVAGAPEPGPRRGEQEITGRLNEVRFTPSRNWLEIDTGKPEPNIVLVKDRKLQAQIAGMFVDGREVRVRAFAVPSDKARRLMLTRIVRVVGRSSKQGSA